MEGIKCVMSPFGFIHPTVNCLYIYIYIKGKRNANAIRFKSFMSGYYRSDWVLDRNMR